MTKPKSSTVYVRNQVFHSAMTGRIYFVPKAKLREDGLVEVVGNKIDISERLQPMLLKKYRTR